MKKLSILIAILFLLLSVLTSCAGNVPTAPSRNNDDTIATMIAATLTAISSMTPKIELTPTQPPTITSPLPTYTHTPFSENYWEQQYIDLYGLTVNLPRNWQIQEINRRPEPTNPGDPIKGHDCAEYQISSFDNLSILFLRPTCGFSEGFPGIYPPGTVIINPENSDQRIGRYFNGTEYVYSDLVTHKYSDSNGDHEETVCLEPPVVITGEGQNFIVIETTFQYLGPQEQIEKALETVDKVVLSITKP